jgi:uncharacterized protein YueI
METDIQSEAISTWLKKGDIEKALSIGLHGAPELRRDEKRRYLGEFRERVIILLSKKQVAEPGVYPEIVKALEDKRAAKMIISGEIDFHLSEKYQKLAEAMGKPVTTISDPEFRGDAGLVVAGDDAVDVKDISVQDRATRLKQLGVPPEVIESAGKKVCERCLEKILKADPDEKINYRKITPGEHFWGERCSACGH